MRPLYRSRSTPSIELGSVRSQAAFVRTLLDEVERVTFHDTEEALSEQVVEELARLGCRFLEVANAVAKAVDGRTARCA
jgi:hypothetical protein